MQSLELMVLQHYREGVLEVVDSLLQPDYVHETVNSLPSFLALDRRLPVKIVDALSDNSVESLSKISQKA